MAYTVKHIQKGQTLLANLLGMNHPGQTWKFPDEQQRPAENSNADYDQDADSLMGRGMILRPVDFTDAFCSHLNNIGIGDGWRAEE